MLRLPDRFRLSRAGCPLASRLRLQPVGQLGALQQARGAQPGQQVAQLAVVGRAAQCPHQRPAGGGVGEGHPSLQGVGNALRVEHLPEQVGHHTRHAVHHRDLLGLHPLVEQRPDLARHQLELGALAPALQQSHRPGRVHPRGVRLEQRALQMVQRHARFRRVVLLARL